MTTEAGFGEQALNKIAEIALASQLKEVERLEVQINTDLSKLARGEVDSINIKINKLLMPHDLILEELQLHFNRVVVKPLSAMLGKIKLTQPSSGMIRAVFNQEDLTRAFNSESFHKRFYQHSVEGIQHVKCHLIEESNVIAFNCQLTLGNEQSHSIAFTATPRIGIEGRGVSLQDVHYLEGEASPELTAAFLTQVAEVLSLREFEQKGVSLQMQQLDIAGNKLTLQAAADIEQFPPA